MSQISDALAEGSNAPRQAGKGDKERQPKLSTRRENYDDIFRRCKDHPEYRAIRPPISGCQRCRELWYLKKRER